MICLVAVLTHDGFQTHSTIAVHHYSVHSSAHAACPGRYKDQSICLPDSREIWSHKSPDDFGVPGFR